MRSIIYHRYGEPADVLQLTEAPDLPAPGKDEVLIRATSRPVHPGDLIGIRGLYRAPGNTSPLGPDGARPGFEGAGVVEAVGAGIEPASGLLPGARVAFFPARWAWGDKVLAQARFVTPIPDDISDAFADPLHVNPLTAALLVRAVEKAGIAEASGDVIVLTAAGSAVAKPTTTLLLRKGLSPIGIVRSSSRTTPPMSDVVEMPMISTDDPNWREQLRHATKGIPIRAVLDAVGGELGSVLASRMGEGGTLISYGDLSGQTINIPALAFSVRRLSITGVSVGSWGSPNDHVRALDMATSLQLARTDADLFDVATEYDLAEVTQAVRHAERPGKARTVLLTSGAKIGTRT
jgi:NADPH:quinone reductase-like Zn-dependent oxidoreductase